MLVEQPDVRSAGAQPHRGREDDVQVEVVRPTGQQSVEARHYLLRRQEPVARRGQLAHATADALDARRAWACANVGVARVLTIVASNPVAEERHRFLRYPTAASLLGVDGQLQTLHQAFDRRPHLCRRRFAEHCEVIRVVDDFRLEASGVTQHLPAQNEATHVDVAECWRSRENAFFCTGIERFH